MVRYVALFVCCLCIGLVCAQEPVEAAVVDESYLEDQFYVGLAYNFITNLPEDAILKNLSYNIQLGFIKDIPLNQRRNFGLGIGLGYDTNSYYTNIVAEEIGGAVTYRFENQIDDLRRSKLETHAVEVPFELRWRTSNAEDYKFWRIYGGIKTAYLFARRSKIVTDSGTTGFTNNDIRQWQYGLTLNFGYNTWNIHLYYALNPLLEEGIQFNSEPFALRPLRVGVVFYIL